MKILNFYKHFNIWLRQVLIDSSEKVFLKNFYFAIFYGYDSIILIELNGSKFYGFNRIRLFDSDKKSKRIFYHHRTISLEAVLTY